MTSNRISLAQAQGMSATELATLPTDHLACLLEEAAAYKSGAVLMADKLTDACGIKFGARAAELRRNKGNDTGRVSFEDGECVVRADLPKKVTYDQAALTRAVQVIRDEWKEKPGDYVNLKIEVSETKYNAWPPTIRDLFTPARTVGTGKPSYVIERSAA